MRDDAYEPAYTFKYGDREYCIPNYMMGAIRRYIEQGIPPGHFLTAVICNDLVGAVSRADDYNMANLPAYVEYFYNETPSSCWGSKQAMNHWMEKMVEIEAKEEPDSI